MSVVLKRRPCKFCGAQILLVRDRETGARVPLQMVTAVYLVDDERECTERLAEPRGADAGIAVSHWETCPQVEQAKRAQQRRRQQSRGPDAAPRSAARARPAARKGGRW